MYALGKDEKAGKYSKVDSKILYESYLHFADIIVHFMESSEMVLR